MRVKCVYPAIRFVLISVICAVPLNAQDLDDYFLKILRTVQKSVDSQKELLVNFLSSEEITIEEFDDNGETKKTTNVISDYRAFPESATAIPNCHVVSEILESLQPSGILRVEREVLSVKENDAPIKEFTEAVWAKGNTYIDFFILFDKQNEKCFEYRLIGKNEERNVYLIEIKQKETDIGESDIGKVDIVRRSWNLRYEGIALIDAGTMEIVQLTRNGVNYNIRYLPTFQFGGSAYSNSTALKTEEVVENYVFFTQYKYEKVKIGDRLFTLPVAKDVRLIRENGRLDTVYKYNYSNHKAFAVDTKISFGAMEESSN